jgi:hypothetical protein
LYIDGALRAGNRGLAGGSSLAQLLAENRKVRNRSDLPPLTEAQILKWADTYYARTEKWPFSESGTLDDAPGETWLNIDNSLRMGHRGLPGGASLAQLLADNREVNNRKTLPRFTIEQILVSADIYYARAGKWPGRDSGEVEEAPGETWSKIEAALRQGSRGLAGGSSLAQLLAEHRGVRNLSDLPPLTEEHILEWADAFHARTNNWPRCTFGAVSDTTTETWRNLDAALRDGRRGLPGGSSLAQLLAEKRGARHRLAAQALSEEQILNWADSYHARTGKWPKHNSGPIDGATGETWSGVENALRKGSRGLAGGSSLPQLLSEKRGVKNHKAMPALTVEQILERADAHYNRTGEWPNQKSGVISGLAGETWGGVADALLRGSRGLAGTSSLAQLLAKHRGVRDRMDLPSLTIDQILAWADEHHNRTGKWPTSKSGPVHGAPGETWGAINVSLERGLRGLLGGSSLAQLIRRYRRN